MNRRKLMLLALLALASLFLADTASADSPAEPHDYTVVTEDGRYILVILSDNAEDGYNQTGFTWPDADIRAKYSQAGLYKNDGSTTPLWTIDWYAFGVRLSSDGQHLVQYGPWARSNDYDELALAFYENGKLLARYSVEQLVEDPASLPGSISHYEWLNHNTFDDAKGELRVETYNGERYTFDVKTGRIISGAPHPVGLKLPPLSVTLGLATLVVFALVVLVLRLKLKGNTTLLEDAGKIGGYDGLR